MRKTRRNLLATSAALVSATGFAGCNGSGGNEDTTSESTATETPAGDTNESESAATATVETAVAAEWNAYRARVWDALALGVGGDTGSGASVAEATFGRFEGASGEYGAHEMLEHANESAYAEFEEALGELRSAGLEAGDVDRAREEATIASDQLGSAQRSLVDTSTANALDLQLFGSVAANAGYLAATGNTEAAATTAANALNRFENADASSALESADGDSYAAFEDAVESLESAAADGDAAGAETAAADAFDAAIGGSYAVADAEAIAGAGHMATLQARGWDAAAVAGMGGPPTAFAHAAALNVYRARAYDCQWLAAQGETERAATMAGDIFAHFEGARAHEALEEGDGEAYEGFEAGLSDLRTAIEDGDGDGIADAVAAVDENLVAGIEALAGANAALLEAGFFRARFADAREQYRLGDTDAAAGIAESLFERFEANELGLHETVEETSESLYTSFEEEHMSGLITAYEDGDDSAVATHHEGVQSTLFEFETTAGSIAVVSGAEGGYMDARGFDAAALGTLGEYERAQAVAQGAFEHFESGAGGYHEAVEHADASIYEAFETELGAIGAAAGNSEDPYPAAKRFDEQAVASVYAIVQNAGGSQTDVAAGIVESTFAHFEDARVHELLEEADLNAYETFEGELDAYATALSEDGDVAGAAGDFADAAQYAAFSIVDAVEQVPVTLRLGEGSSSEGESDLSGGPNVVEGVPEDADHVVDMAAVAFEPSEVTISQGDTVAWTHAAGEAHTVFAYEEEIPADAGYWASGDFDSQSAAEEGWSEGSGAVQSGQSYVHTFETAGTHEYYCAPHEQAGMTGTITVE